MRKRYKIVIFNLLILEINNTQYLLILNLFSLIICFNIEISIIVNDKLIATPTLGKSYAKDQICQTPVNSTQDPMSPIVPIQKQKLIQKKQYEFWSAQDLEQLFSVVELMKHKWQLIQKLYYPDYSIAKLKSKYHYHMHRTSQQTTRFTTCLPQLPNEQDTLTSYHYLKQFAQYILDQDN